MLNVKEGDVVQFRYHDKTRKGRVERTWPSTGRNRVYKSGGFCLDHGDHYKSYSNSKVRYLAKTTQKRKKKMQQLVINVLGFLALLVYISGCIYTMNLYP